MGSCYSRHTRPKPPRAKRDGKYVHVIPQPLCSPAFEGDAFHKTKEVVTTSKSAPDPGQSVSSRATATGMVEVTRVSQSKASHRLTGDRPSPHQPPPARKSKVVSASAPLPSTPDIRERQEAVPAAASPAVSSGPKPRVSPFAAAASAGQESLKYVEVGQLGVGRTGTSKLLRDKTTDILMAAKFVPHTAGEALSKSTEREIVNHRRLLHPNIIKFHEVFVTDEHLVIVMEYASGGHLEERITTGGRLSEAKARVIFKQILDAVDYCHRRKVAHRSLRAENILLSGSFFQPIVKISGFGYSVDNALDSIAVTQVALPAYQPPELLKATRNDAAGYDAAQIDLWALGVILFFMLAGTIPFQDPTTPGMLTQRVMRNIVNAAYAFPSDLQLSPACRDLVARLFDLAPERRITARQALEHPWLAGDVLPQVRPPKEAKQSEADIAMIIGRARMRREEWRAARAV